MADTNRRRTLSKARAFTGRESAASCVHGDELEAMVSGLARGRSKERASRAPGNARIVIHDNHDLRFRHHTAGSPA